MSSTKHIRRRIAERVGRTPISDRTRTLKEEIGDYFAAMTPEEYFTRQFRILNEIDGNVSPLYAALYSGFRTYYHMLSEEDIKTVLEAHNITPELSEGHVSRRRDRKDFYRRYGLATSILDAMAFPDKGRRELVVQLEEAQEGMPKPKSQRQEGEDPYFNLGEHLLDS